MDFDTPAFVENSVRAGNDYRRATFVEVKDGKKNMGARQALESKGVAEIIADLADMRTEVPELQGPIARLEAIVNSLAAKVSLVPTADLIQIESGVQLIWHSGIRHLRVFAGLEGECADYLYTAIVVDRVRKTSEIIRPINSDRLAELVEQLGPQQYAAA